MNQDLVQNALRTTPVLARLLLSVVLIVLPLHVAAEVRIALVIGNGAYQSSPLSDPPNDVQLMADTLTGLGFDVVGYVNVDQQELRNAIRDFGNRLKAQKESVGLFYYSGHGMQVQGENYMIPVGVDIEDEDDVSIYGVGMKEVLTRMRVAKNVMNFVMLDACRDNPFEKSFKSPTNGLGRMEAPKGTLIAFAAQPHKVARQGPGKYSYFTEALAQEIIKPGISARDMLLNVRIAVHENTNHHQLPVVEDQMLAKFYFHSLPVIASEGRKLFATPDIRLDVKESEITLRSWPIKNLSETLVMDLIYKFDFFSSGLWHKAIWSNPSGKGIDNQFELRENGSIVYDRSTELTWQQSGSATILSYREALIYIDSLNNNRFAGYSDWRLPTVEEAMSIVEPKTLANFRVPEQRSIFIDSIFDGKQYYLLTSDQQKENIRWYVYYNLGDTASFKFYDDTQHGYVRAIR